MISLFEPSLSNLERKQIFKSVVLTHVFAFYDYTDNHLLAACCKSSIGLVEEVKHTSEQRAEQRKAHENP